MCPFLDVLSELTIRRVGASVLVHCKMGVSRSASTVIAYAMKHYSWSLEVAYAYVKVCQFLRNSTAPGYKRVHAASCHIFFQL